MKYSEKIAKRLNTLLAKTYEAERIYELGAERAERPPLKSFLKRMGEQRHNFSLELQKEIRAYGHQPLKPGNSEQPPAGKSRAIPVEVSSVESSSLRAYECLLADTETRFPPPTERILTRQKNGILASLRSEWIP